MFVWILKTGDKYRVEARHNGRAVGSAMPEGGQEALRRAFRMAKDTGSRVAFIPKELKPTPPVEKVA